MLYHTINLHNHHYLYHHQQISINPLLQLGLEHHPLFPNNIIQLPNLIHLPHLQLHNLKLLPLILYNILPHNILKEIIRASKY